MTISKRHRVVSLPSLLVVIIIVVLVPLLLLMLSIDSPCYELWGWIERRGYGAILNNA